MIKIAESLTLLVTTQIEGGETVVANGKFLGGGVGSGLQDGDTVVLCVHLSANSSFNALPSLGSSELRPAVALAFFSQTVCSVHIPISTDLQHVQQGSLSRIIESEE